MEGSYTYLKDDYLKIKYDALQFHFHAPSEHTIDGEFRDLELHIVHYLQDGDLLKLSVLGIFFDIEKGGNEPNEFI